MKQKILEIVDRLVNILVLKLLDYLEKKYNLNNKYKVVTKLLKGLK